MKWKLQDLPVTVFYIIILSSCSTPGGPAGIFGSKTPHEQYGDKLKDAGLKETTLGRIWFESAEQSLATQLSVAVPYQEKGYFPAERPLAVGLRLSAKRGEQLTIAVEKKPASEFLLYLDLWRVNDDSTKRPKLIASADSTLELKYEVNEDGNYIVRLQPELLKGGEYTLTITSGPSLAFPFHKNAKASKASFWGAERDRGARKHEGIDIMAPRRTPVVAAAEGVVTRVNENNLGGKTVWLRPNGKDYNLYYAHLDEQLVTEGQRVNVGDTLGLVGTTGNARGGAPHLHFGIYTNSGAVNPFPFLNPAVQQPSRVLADVDRLGEELRTTGKATRLYQQPSGSKSVTLDAYTLLRAEAGTARWYRVRTGNNLTGFIQNTDVVPITTEIKSLTLSKDRVMFDAPDFEAAQVTTLPKGTKAGVLAQAKTFFYIKYGAVKGWIDNTTP